MACSLNEDQIGDVYKLIYKKLSGATTSESFDLEELIKKIYNGVLEATEDTAKALQYAQAVPDIFNIVTNNSKINDILDTIDFDTNIVRKLRKQFQDLEFVNKYVNPAPKTAKGVNDEIKDRESSRNNIELNDDSELEESDLQKRNAAKIEYPNRTSIQLSKPTDPNILTEQDRNKLDKNKITFGIVLRNIVQSIRNRSIDDTEVLYGDTPIVLSLMKNSMFPDEYKLKEHLQVRDEDSVGVYAVITDPLGNYLYFDDKGNIVENEDEGKVVYTFLRKPAVHNNELILLYNRFGKKFKTTLVDAGVIAEREISNMKAQGYKIEKGYLEERTKEIYEEQVALMNGLYNLRETVLESDNPIQVEIVDGSYGVVNDTIPYITFEQAGLTMDSVKKYEVISDEKDPKKGWTYVTVKKDTPVGPVTQTAYLQRGDFDNTLADKLATVLTTKAKLLGEELTPKQRKDYFEVYIDNSIPKNKTTNREAITAKVLDDKLVVSINGKEIPQEKLYTDEAKKMIMDHLMNKRLDRKGFPIPVSIQNNFEYKGKNYTDYNISGDKVSTELKSYGDLFTSKAKIQFSEDAVAYEGGLNPYLIFSIPGEFTEDIEFDMATIQKSKPAPQKTKEEVYKEVKKEAATPKTTTFEEDVEVFTEDSIDYSDVEIDDTVDMSDMEGFDPEEWQRSKKLENFLDRVFTTKADRERADAWWNNSPLSKHISLERITQIVNSNAFATFSKSGITLFEGDGGTSVDLYHESWHGFSQLFLTKPEKVKLYNELKAQPKWADKSYWEIEEDIAEDFRDYARSKGRKQAPKGFLGRVFKRIYNFLNELFGKATKEEVILRPRDIASVKELFDKLYYASERPELLQNMQPSTENMMFKQLDRSKLIVPVKEYESSYAPFTESESIKAVTILDSLLPDLFKKYNASKADSAGAIKILYNPDNRISMYNYMEKKLSEKLDELRVTAADLAINGEDVPDSILNNMKFIGKILDNYGDAASSVAGKSKRGLIAYHLENSRFKVLSNTYTEIENDPTDLNQSQIFKTDGGNTQSSKDMASESTKTILSCIYKVDMDKFEVVTNSEGKKVFNIVYELDPDTGFPVLEDFNIMWNRLAKILAGSFDKTEMYNRLQKSISDYPGIVQLLSLLPNPSNTEYKDSTEFDLDVNFWQDLKLPRLSYSQLNIHVDKSSKDAAVYKATVGDTDFDTSKVQRDWEIGFMTQDPATNPFVEIDTLTGQLMLNTKKVIQAFTNKDGSFKLEQSKAFLKAIGINLDYSNKTIKETVNDPNFGNKSGINHIFNTIREIDKMTGSVAIIHKKNPVKYIIEGLLDETTGERSNVSNSRVKELAKLQTAFADKYSNFSALSPEGNRVWEHFLDSTITRVITSINSAKNWDELTKLSADPNNKYRHMRWLSEENNTYSMHSYLLKSLFDFATGERKNNSLLIKNIAGTQVINDNTTDKEGVSTASMDGTGKFLQEVHTMLMSGIEEFMRHASKQTAQSLMTTKGIDVGTAKKAKNLYIDIEDFASTDGERNAFNIIEGYITGEANRIFRFSSDFKKFSNYKGYNQKVKRKDNKDTEVLAGQAFTAFDDVLTEDTQEELYAIIDKAVKDKQEDFDLMSILHDNTDLRKRVKADVVAYFNDVTKETKETLDSAKYIDTALKTRVPNNAKMSNDQVENVLMKAYVYNSWIHKFETAILIYGDFAQYKHAKEDFHKRNAGFGGGGRSFSADAKILLHVNTMKKYYADRMGMSTRSFDGTLRTAILRERKIDQSIYYDDYYDALVEDYTERFGDKAKAEELATKVLDAYNNMEIGDGQGHITFESYRALRKLEGNWLPEQEELYKKVAKGEDVSVEDVVNFFPPYKLQYTGNIESTGLPITSFHKYSLAPIIPGVAKEGTPLYDLHMKMMTDQIDYVVYESGSKIGHIGSGDEIFDKDGNFLPDSTFTPNVIFTEFLKNQTEINSNYKEKSIFSTQMRKLILDNLYNNGIITTKNENHIVEPIVKKYLNDVSEYTELVKLELLEEIGYDEVSKDKYVPRDKDSVGKLLGLIRANLENDDSYSDALIDFIDALEDGELLHDLSLHPEAAKIEKVLLSLINKRIIKQKVKGEPLVQVSSAMYENNVTGIGDFRNATDAEKKKWRGSNVLPTYHRKTVNLTAKYENSTKDELKEALKNKLKIQQENSAYWTDSHKQSLRDEISHLEDRIAGKKPRITTTGDGKTAAMKVMIALQGDYTHLLNLEYKGKIIGDIDTLNKAIKDDEWLDANNGANRKAITLVGVRIPVQGLNSMEFMEVYEFLPPQAGNIIIPPAEIVAKSGGDFDIDKLTIFMTNIAEDGKLREKTHQDNEWIKEQIKELNARGESTEALFKAQKAGLENELINDMKEILELPQNFVSLITPNGTFLLKEIADNLAREVSDYNPLATRMTKARSTISPTRVLEPSYNIYKHESNIVGKKTLGLGAIENTFNILFNAIGAVMPETYQRNDRAKNVRKTNLALRHNVLNGRISLSDIYDVDNINKIADIFSQAINGWVDVEKDAWIFFIQGNYEVAPILLYLAKAGVPIKEAIYFVSQPLVREYVKEQRLAKSTFAEVLGKKPDAKNLVKSKAASVVIGKYFPKTVLTSKAKVMDRLDTGDKLLTKLFEDRDQKAFNEKEMRSLIEKSANDKTALKSDLSLTMFLHYLQIEDQIKGITRIKRSSNPDTSTQTSVSDIEFSEENIDTLLTDESLRPILESLMNDSVISSFFNGPLALALSQPLFKLRYHKSIRNYLNALDKDGTLEAYAADTFGEGKKDVYKNVFRNDFVSYLFQNALLKYELGDKYMSYEMKETMDTKNFVSKNFGVHIKTNANGSKTLFINKKNIAKEFNSKAWEVGNQEENIYTTLGLHQVDFNTFALEKGQNIKQYMKFVIEREYLRSIYPKPSEQTKAEYEEYLANKALDNTFNFYHLFNNKNTAYAKRVNNVLMEHPDLAKRFEILGNLRLENDKDNTIFNLSVTDKDINSTKANLYTKNLKDLANPVLLKTMAKELKLTDADVKNISDLFAMFPMFAYLQSGINKSSYNLVPLVDSTPFTDIMDNVSKKIVSLMNESSIPILSDFITKFNNQNNKFNKNKNRFRNYLSTFDLNKKETKATQPQADVEERVNNDYTFNSSGILQYKNKELDNLFLKLRDEYKIPSIPKTKEETRLFRLKNALLLTKNADTNDYVKIPDLSDIFTNTEALNLYKQYLNNINNSRDLFIERFKNDSLFSQEIEFRPGEIKKGYEFIPKTTKSLIDQPSILFLELFKNAGLKPGTDPYRAKLLELKQFIDSKTTILLNNAIKLELGITTTQQQADTEVETKNLIETNESGIYMYDSVNKKPKYFDEITTDNSKVIFIHTLSQKESEGGTFKGSTGQSYIRFYAPDMSIDIITSLENNDNFSTLDPSNYNNVKSFWEGRFKAIKQIIANGGQVAFPTSGFGDVEKMPDELFVYLSRRLYEEFRYLNPGSLLYNEVTDIISNTQGISDEEIWQELGFESDPFKCS